MSGIVTLFIKREAEKTLLPAELLVEKMHSRTRALRIRYYKAMIGKKLTAAAIGEILGISRALCYQQLTILENQGFVRKAHVEWGKTTWEIVE